MVGGISFGVGDSAPTQVNKAEGTAPTPVKRAGPVEVDATLMPMRVVAVVDLIPSGSHNAGAHPPEHPVAVDPGDFDALFKKLQPKAAMEVENVLLEGAKSRIDFAPRSMKSFRPDGLTAEIPLLRSLLDGRKVLEQLRDGTQTVEGATTELNRLWNNSSLVARALGGVEIKPPPGAARSPKAPPKPATSDAVDALMDMVDMGTSSSDDAVATPEPSTVPVAAPAPAGDKSRFGKFIAMVAHSGKDRPGANPSEGIRLIEKAFSVQLGAIVQHEEFRRLERAWRGISFLASRTPKHDAKLEVMCARPDDVAEALQRAIDHAPGISPPVTFAVVDVTADGDAASFARLRKLADIGEANVVPIITNTSAGLFGRDDLSDIDRLDNKQGLFDDPARAPWRSEANRPAMLWIALALNRVLSRKAYDKRTSRIREATIEELPNDDTATVWMNPCWAVASLATKSFEKHGWPCGITGVRDGGLIEDLPVREVEVASYDGAEKVAIPNEVFFSTETQRALGRLGVLALAAQPNQDSCYLINAATAYVPPPKRTQDYDTAEDQVRLPQASLVDQLFVARLAQFLQALGTKISGSNAPNDIKQVLEAAIWELFKSGPSGMEITVDINDQGGRVNAAVTVRPRRFLGVSMEEITLGVPLA